MAKSKSNKELEDSAKDLTRLFQSQTKSVQELNKLFQGLSDGPVNSFSRKVELAGENFENIVELNRDLNKELIQATQTEVEIKKLMEGGLSAKVAELVYAKKIAEANARNLGLSADQLKTFTEQYDKAIAYQERLDKINEDKEHELKISEKIHEIEEKRKEALEKIGVNTSLIKDFLQGGAARTLAMTVAAEKMGEAFGEAYKELKEEGLSTTQAAHEAMSSFTDSVKSFGRVSAASVREARKGFMETGGSLHDAEEAGRGAALMAERFGGSAAQAGKAIGNLNKLPGLTKEAADNAAEFGAKLSIAANVPADTVTKALADNMDAAAKAGPGMTESFAQAAVNAQKIGVQFSAITGMADKLLDFESSINAQMEASVLLGKEINLDRAREAALAGDYATVQKEILAQVGSEAEFTKMNVLQKQKLAEAMGVSVGDLAKMVKGQGELTDGTEIQAQHQSKIAQFAGDAANWSMKNAASLMTMLPTLAQMFMQMKMIKALQGGGGDKLSQSAVDKTKGLSDKMSGATDEKGKGSKGFLKGLGEGLASIGKNFKDVVQGALALGITGVALAGSFAIAMKMLGDQDPVQMLAVAGSLSMLGLTVALMGKMGSNIIKGAIAMAILGGALIPAAYAFSLLDGISVEQIAAFSIALPLLALAAAGLGFLIVPIALGAAALVALGVGMIAVAGGLAVLQAAEGGIVVFQSLTEIAANAAGLGSVALSLLRIGAGLGVIAIAGLAAMPAIGSLIALAAVAPALIGLGAAIGGMFGGGGGEKEDKMTELITEIKGLREDLNKGGVINMDSKKVGDTMRLYGVQMVKTY